MVGSLQEGPSDSRLLTFMPCIIPSTHGWAGHSNSLLTCRRVQKWWDVTSEARLERLWLTFLTPPWLFHSLSPLLWGKPGCPAERPMEQGTGKPANSQWRHEVCPLPGAWSWTWIFSCSPTRNDCSPNGHFATLWKTLIQSLSFAILDFRHTETVR